MPVSNRMPPAIWLALTAGPALAIGVTLWFVGSLVPECVATESKRLPAPDAAFDLVVFSRDCGDTPPNTQATLLPHGETLPYDAASFLSMGTVADLAPRWDAYGNIEITLPGDGEIFRQDETVAGIAVIYR